MGHFNKGSNTNISPPAIMLLIDRTRQDATQLGESLHLATEGEIFIPTTLEEARQLLAERAFIALVCDIKIGNLWTTTLLEEFGAALKEAGTRILVMSSDEGHRQPAEKAGANLFMLKPVSETTLLTLVKGMVHTPHLYNSN
ncbi:MAG: hypothetical protein BroJett018_33720 [Chloroflexota bacterium]|nr:MAG: hypothetical protein BroJett018_33720 [Chloroflexota bacterium]